MRSGSISLFASAAVFALAAGGCGEPTPDANASAPRTLEGDAALIASAQKLSDVIGGCTKPADAVLESKVVGLEKEAIILLGCSKSEFATTVRLFLSHGADAPAMLAIPDYDASGWFATDQASMAELDAGTGVLTTMRKGATDGACGSEGTYHWDGKRFAVQEMHWQACGEPDAKGPPYPIIWPTQQGAAVDPNGATPEP